MSGSDMTADRSWPEPGDATTLLTEWARLLISSLRRVGLRQVVLSPGSRSTPFAWAALREPGLDCRTIIDERSAAFFAVGHARMTGEPALLICTSGSAAGNYFPALIEAAESATPVLVLTADRPLELQHAAAPQTIDQVKLYGDYARAYFELGTPDADPRMLRAVPRLAAQALLTTRTPRPGPVHLNARARKPLEPVTDGPGADELAATVDRLLARLPTAVTPEVRPTATAVESVAHACRGARRGLIVCGPAAPHDAATAASLTALAAATGFPVVAEPASQLRFADLRPATTLDAFAAALEVPGFARAHAPDVLLQIGRPPTASAWGAALERWPDTNRYVLCPHGWADPWSSAAGIVHGALDATVRLLAAAVKRDAGPGPGAGADTSPNPPAGAVVEEPAESRGWLDELQRADAVARTVLDDAVAAGFSEAAAVRAAVDRLPRGAVLALGNSLPIREVDTFVPAGDRGLTVWFQRGANGIDGLISGAAGAAAASGRPTTLLIGDVSFVHDIGGLRAMRDLPAPLTVVVLNNGGGRIFDRLPLADVLAGTAAGDPARDAWLTPTGANFEAAARTFGLPFTRADDAATLAAALDSMADGGVVEVVIPEGGTTEHQAELRRRLESALAP